MPVMTAATDTRSIGILANVLNEVLDGSGKEGWLLNPNDPGLLKSLDKLSADDASRIPSGGGASIAAHTDHVRYGLELLNRWSRGEDPWATADFSRSWKRTTVGDAEWQALRETLRREAGNWQKAILKPREMNDMELTGVIASVAHVAYHLGAMRQIDRAMKGPLESEGPPATTF